MIWCYNMFMDTTKKADGFQNQYLFVLPEGFLEVQQKNALFRHLLVTDIGFFPCARYHYRKRMEGCGTAILLFCVSGEGTYSFGGQALISLKPGQVCLLPPHMPHEYAADENNPWSVYWLHCRGDLIAPYCQLLGNRTPLSVGRSAQDTLLRLFDESFSILKAPVQTEEYFSLCQKASDILGTVAGVARYPEQQRNDRGGQAIALCVQYMKDKLHETLTLHELASYSSYSISHLNTLFKNATGSTPIGYYLRLKMQAASKDLFFTDRPVKDIAVSYGIMDAYYFSRIFKRIMGQSPVEYRNQPKG